MTNETLDQIVRLIKSPGMRWKECVTLIKKRNASKILAGIINGGIR
jgi:hypothetical protein